jgi:signal transduction histidine kinase
MASVLRRAPVSPDESYLWPLTGRAYWIAVPLVAVAYSSVAALSLLLAIPPGYASAVWPPAGIAVAAWLAFGARIWPGILIGAAIANLGVIGTPVPVALAIGAGNAAEAAVAGLLIRQFIQLRHRFDHPGAVWRFAAIAFFASLVAASNGVGTLALAGQLAWAETGTHWLTWWLGDATGIIIVTPLLLCWSESGNRRSAGERMVEQQLFAALLVLLCALVLTVNLAADATQTVAYLMIPMVTWAAARLDQRAVTAASFAISAVAVLDMLDGAANMFTSLSLNGSLLLLQLFVSAVALTGLTLSALAGEIVRMNARHEALCLELERQVKERTRELDQTLSHQRLLARRMVRIRDEERARLAADLHDGVAQDVTSLAVNLDLMRVGKHLKSEQWLDERLNQALAIIRRVAVSLREVIGGLRLPGIEGLALTSALRRHAAEFEARTGILVTVSAEPGRDTLPLKVKEALLRIFLEALANVAKHADANSVRVVLESVAQRTRLAIQDDGRGFDNAAADRHATRAGAGLLIMRERAAALGATFSVQSAPGSGTLLVCAVPHGT